MNVREDRVTTSRRARSRGVSVAACALMCAALALLSYPAAARVTVVPTVTEVDAVSGGRARFFFAVSNDAAYPYDAQTTVADLAVAPNGFPRAAREPRERGASSWLAVSPATFSLRPGEVVRVQAEARPPRGLFGTYSAMVTWRLSGKPHGDAPSRMEINAVVLARVRGSRTAKPEISINSIDLMTDPNAPGSGKWMARVPVTNSGSLHTRVAGTLVIRQPAGGPTVASLPVTSGQGLILPAATRDLVGSLGKTLPDGAYIALAVVHAESSRLEARRAGYFLVRNGVVEAKPPDETVLRQLAVLLPPVSSAPLAMQESLPGGGRRTSTVRADNHTGRPLTVRALVSASPNGASNSASLPSAIPPERYRPQWFTISPSVAQIEPGREQVFRVTSTVPRGSAGEYFAYLLVTPTQAGSAGSPLPPTGALLAVTAKGTAAQEAQLDDVAVRSAHGSPPTYSFKITNTGNVSAALTGVVAVLASDGKEIDRKPFTLPMLLLPSCSISVKVDGERPLPPGHHKIRVTVNTEGGRPVSKETVVVVK